MTASTLAVGIVVIGLASGVIAASSPQNWGSLFGLICGPACLLMIAEMLFSFNMYRRRAPRTPTTGDSNGGHPGRIVAKNDNREELT